MARKRIIDPDFWLDEDLAKVSPLARLLFIGLWGICDDNYATLPDKPDWIKAQVFPYQEIDTHTLLTELSLSGHIIHFVDNGKPYWFIKNFLKHQTINRPSKPKYPKFTEDSLSTHSELKELKERKEDFLKNSRETLKAKWGIKK